MVDIVDPDIVLADGRDDLPAIAVLVAVAVPGALGAPAVPKVDDVVHRAIDDLQKVVAADDDGEPLCGKI